MAYRYQQGDRPLPGYTIQRGVGRGGFGEVYYATSDGGKEVALKHLRENPQVELRGVAHVLNLKSPHLVAIHDVRQSADGDFFVVMEFVNGPSLRDLMNDAPNGLGPQKAAYFAREIANGLAYLHDRGIVHRDVKPGNIFYEDGYVKIGDYGLSKFMASSQHSGQTVSVGTVHYMAPEVGSGNYDRTIDVYALGVMLYEMLLGRVPFGGSSMGEVLMKHLTAQPEVDELPAPFPTVIRKALAKDPKDRYQTVNELVADLFAEEDLSKSVASFEPHSLSVRAAKAAVAIRTPNHAPMHAFGTGSSNVGIDVAPPVLNRPAPPPIPGTSEASNTVSGSVPFMLGSASTIAAKNAQCLLITGGMSIATGLVTGGPQLIPAVFLTVVAMTAAMYSAEWFSAFRTGSSGSWWPKLVVAGVVAFPLSGIFDQAFPFPGKIHVALGLAILATNWRSLLRNGKTGEGSPWTVFVAGAIGFGLGFAFSKEAIWVVAAIAGTTALCMQTLGQLWPTDIPEDEDEDEEESGEVASESDFAGNETMAADGFRGFAGGIAIGGGAKSGPNANVREPRSNVVRFAWLLATCASLVGMLFCFIAPNVLWGFGGDEWNITITIGVVLASVFLFCVWCAIPKYKNGIWRGILRKAVFFGGTAMASGCGTAMGLFDTRDEAFAMLLFGIIVGGLASIVVWFVPIAPFEPRTHRESDDAPELKEKRTLARRLSIAGGATLGLGIMLLPILMATTSEHDWEEVLPSVCIPLGAIGIGLLVTGFVMRSKLDRGEPAEENLEIPLRRDIVLNSMSDVGPILLRFASMHDYKLKSDGDMFWSFRRGEWTAQFWQSDIRKWKTKFNIAGFADSAGGYTLRCIVDVDSAFNPPGKKALRKLSEELDDLESLLAGTASGFGIERNRGVTV